MLPWQETYTREYRTAKGYRILIYVLMPPLILVFLALPFLLMRGKNPFPAGIIGFGVLGVGLAGFFVYGLIETVKGRVIIGAREVSQVGAFNTKTLALSEIAGYRVEGKYTRIYPTEAYLPTFKIGDTTERYAELQQWLAARYPDLDQVDTERATAAILADDELGPTPEARAAALTRAVAVARTLNIAGGAAGAWAIAYAHPYEWAVGACLLVPVLAAVALWLLPRTLRIDEKRNSGHPAVLIAVLVPCLGLLIRALFDYELVSHAPLWPRVGTAATGAALVLAIGSRKFLFRAGSMVSVGLHIGVLAVLYGYGATSTLNAVYDPAEAVLFTPQVVGKHYNSGKQNTYYLKLSPWGPVATTEDVTVSKAIYQQTVEGQKITVALRPGRLGVPWFAVVE
ncbi:hypothetical protein [Hymenobacter convexus]|uniref:hypothetical protein n=1 Tax=Hymenobacter sp. CA1UV-4 TaxID=3063782 RepID=UPI0027123B18|nr:hypothetical protein [Hymenobacter sp. CA1UV-4]MDO7850460.1 hypothetical protein [Hymenobacter sp. CA1UV-4]